jgi:hypothetical protein
MMYMQGKGGPQNREPATQLLMKMRAQQQH